MWALVAVRLVDESIWFLVPGNVEPLRRDLGAGYGTVAAMFAVAMVTSLVANIVIAATDGRSRKPITVAGTFVVAAALVVQAGAPGPALLLVGGGPARRRHDVDGQRRRDRDRQQRRRT